MIFKFRAECMKDVGELLLRIIAKRIEIETPDTGIPDVVVTIDSPWFAGEALDLEDFRGLCAAIDDGHVMAQTVALAHAPLV